LEFFSSIDNPHPNSKTYCNVYMGTLSKAPPKSMIQTFPCLHTKKFKNNLNCPHTWKLYVN
jgi:hypothetical protein